MQNNKRDDEEDDVPLPSLQEEVAENIYDWSDPERNDYDSDDSFMAPDNDDGGGDTTDDNDDDEVPILSPRSLEEMERRGRPRRKTRPPVRYSPPLDQSDDERYTYDCVGADDDGQSEMAPEEDDSSVYNAEASSDDEQEGEDDDEDDDEDDEDDVGQPLSSGRGVKRKMIEDDSDSEEEAAAS